jgi:hypothetical protein
MTHRDDRGNVQVDFVWGNMPLQPNDDRTDQGSSFGGGSGDHGWTSTYSATSDTLRTAPYSNTSSVQDLFEIYPQTPADSHTIATLGWSNFPGYIPNYAGDADPGLEAVVPNLIRLTRSQAEYELGKVNLDLRMNYHTPTINYVESTDKTVRVYAYDTNAEGGGYAQAYLVGLRAGDKVYVNNTLETFSDLVTITAVHEDGTDSWIEFEVETAFSPALDGAATGNIWAGPELERVVTVMRGWNQPGDIKDEGTNIYVRGLDWSE